MKKRKRKTDNKALDSWLIQRLRKAHMAWPPSSWALKDARVGPNQYKCADCNQIYSREEVEKDHIEAVIDPLDGNRFSDGSRNWHKTITRMFPQKQGYSILCIGCHIVKTWLERQLRNNTVPFDYEYLFDEVLYEKHILDEKMKQWKENLE